MSTIN
jgi:hypothetical protein